MSDYPQASNGNGAAAPPRESPRNGIGDAALSAFADGTGRVAPGKTPACLLHVDLGKPAAGAVVQEFVELAKAGGAEIRGLYRARRVRPTAKYFIGAGKAGELREHLERNDARLLIVNHDLSPAQERNLEHLCRARVLDRSGLILDIFSQRARSHEGKLQVELAQLGHLSTRLVRGWSHLERQKGGIGLRGPGEKQLETDRRLIGRRMTEINKRLERIKSCRRLGRRLRRKHDLPTVALVGYTNAGKTALFNRLTESSEYSSGGLFATLDPVMRRFELDRGSGGSAAVLSDTVGFISDLPHTLVEAFNATLLEVCEADLLLHVVDAAAAERDEHRREVEQVLHTIGAHKIPKLTVFNKSDLTGCDAQIGSDLRRDENGRPVMVTTSALTGAGVEALRRAVAERLAPKTRCYEARIPVGGGGLRSVAYASGEVVHEEYLCGEGWRLRLRLADVAAGGLLKRARDLRCALELSEL